MDVKKLFSSTRTAVAAAVVAVAGLIAFFAGLFPEWQVPVMNEVLAAKLIDILTYVGVALVIGFTARNPQGGVDWQGIFNILVEVLKAAGTTPPEEKK